MSTPFTTPGDASWQTLLDEITLAYSERRQALGQPAYVPVDGRDVQLWSWWDYLQLWTESCWLYYIDHVSGPLSPGGTDFLFFTQATWRAAAGLNASGFRRVPEGVEWDGITDPVWSYGRMQAGDIIGPWIFEDLQKGLKAMKWLPFFPYITKVKNVFPTVTGSVSYAGSGSGTDFGVWYTLGGTRLGGSGTYTVSLDERAVNAAGSTFYISLGMGVGYWGSYGSGVLLLDTGYGSGALPYSASVTFLDAASLVGVYGCRMFFTDADSYSCSYAASSATVSASLDSAKQQAAFFEFFPVIKPPFTNA